MILFILSIIILPLFMGYLLGSIPFGLVLTRLAGLGDIRAIGSGNIGATNVLRTGNKPLALATLLLDSGEGAIAVLLTYGILQDPYSAAFATVGALLGHSFPVWLKFKGGKGVATTLGTLLAYAWPVGLACCATWVMVALIFRISSLSALIAVLLSPLYFWLFADFLDILPPEYITAGVPLCVFIIILVSIRHKDNIKRLSKGQEPKIGEKKNKQEP